MGDFDVKCVCDRSGYSHYMNEDCAKLLRKKLREWRNAQLTKRGKSSH
jgi:hypothetical protein